MKRLLSIAIALVFMLSACNPAPAAAPAQSNQPAAPQGEKVVLKYWNGFTGPDRPVLEALVKEFNDTHPNIEVQMDIMPWDSLFQKLLTSMTVGAEPDLAAFSFRNLPEYAKAGVLMPLDDLYGSSGIDPQTFHLRSAPRLRITCCHHPHGSCLSWMDLHFAGDLVQG